MLVTKMGHVAYAGSLPEAYGVLRTCGRLREKSLEPYKGRAEMNAARFKSSSLLKLALLAAAVLAACVLALAVKVEPSQAAFPGQNGKIAFMSTRDGGRNEIYTMNADGTNQTRLTNNETQDVSPTFSPDGTKIAFSRENDPTNEDYNIWVMNADGSGQTDLNNPDLASKDEGPSFSPDGTKIAFSRTLYGVHTDPEIYVMNADGSGQTNISNNPASWDFDPVFSPDGKQIAFTSSAEAYSPGSSEIYKMNADGSNQTNLSNNPGSDDREPSFSPDGTKIAFTSYRDGAPEIYVMNADGSGQTNLTNNPGSPSDSTAYDRQPAFSPDGTKIAFERLTRSPVSGFINSEIWVMNADGSNQTNISNNERPDEYPDWQPLPPTSPAYDFSGFFSPVDNFPTLNQAKAGSAIPVKFSLNGDQGLEIFAQNYPKSEPIACEGTDPVDAIEQTLSANSSGLTYDATTDQYIYVWKTNNDWRGCRQLVMKLNDGTEHRANFKFTR